MLPNRFTPTTSTSERANLPAWLLILLIGIGVLAILAGWVLLSMGTPPEATSIQTEIPVQL
jgi:hypothetical protein